MDLYSNMPQVIQTRIEHQPKLIPKSTKINTKSTENDFKINHNIITVASWSPRWAQGGPKSQEDLETLFLGFLLGFQDWLQIHLKSKPNMLLFWFVFGSIKKTSKSYFWDPLGREVEFVSFVSCVLRSKHFLGFLLLLFENAAGENAYSVHQMEMYPPSMSLNNEQKGFKVRYEQ